MCGVAGFVSTGIDKSLGETILSKMLHSIHHRGPDGRGKYIGSDCFLGMTRLSIVDVEGGTQPFFSNNGSIVAFLNGEIYNHKEIRAAFGNVDFKTQCDTEVLPHLFERYGLDMPHKIRGMYVIVILDLRKNRLHIFRDSFGQKPLYFTARNNLFAFASEIKSLFAGDWISPSINNDAFLDYLTWSGLPAPHTHFKDVYKLPPGSVLSASIDGAGQYTVQAIDPPLLFAERTVREKDQSAIEIFDGFVESVKAHLLADVPIGILLSSGLDSRLIALAANQAGIRNLRTYSAAFPDLGEDSEHIEAKKISSELGFEHSFVNVTASDYSTGLGLVLHHLDEPIGDPAALALHRVCALASQDVKVLLSGEGSDEIFAGYYGRYSAILKAMHQFKKLKYLGVFSNAFDFEFIGSRYWNKLMFIESVPKVQIVAGRAEHFLNGLDYRIAGIESLRHVWSNASRIAKDLPPFGEDALAAVRQCDLFWNLPEVLLQKADKMSMACSVELRTPFLDKSLFSIARQLSNDHLLDDNLGVGKAVLRLAMTKVRPEWANAPKRGFPAPLWKWFCGPLRDTVRDSVFSSNAAWRDVLCPDGVEWAYSKMLSGSLDFSQFFYKLWAYEVWRSNVALDLPLKNSLFEPGAFA